MIALFGAIVGFLSSTFPHILDMFKDKGDKKHELAVMDRQMQLQLQMQERGAAQRLDEITLERDLAQYSFDAEEVKSIHQKMQITGIWFIDFLNGSVKPVLTYLFMVAYLTVKYAQWQILKSIHVTDVWEIALQLWNAEDQAIWAAIISYHFGSRAISRFKR